MDHCVMNYFVMVHCVTDRCVMDHCFMDHCVVEDHCIGSDDPVRLQIDVCISLNGYVNVR